jgi:hypothetical protein
MKSRTTSNNNDAAVSSTAGIFSSLRSSVSTFKTRSAELGSWLCKAVADNRWTILNAAGNGVGSLITACYYVDAIVDIFADLDGQGNDEFVADLSLPGFATGITMAVLITSGSIYAHFVLNTNSTWAIKHRIYSQGENESEIDSRIELSSGQTFFRWLDYFSHVADNATTYIFIFNFVIRDPSREEKIIYMLATTASGILSSMQDWITCGHNMRLHNRNRLMDEKQLQNVTAVMRFNFIKHEYFKQFKEYALANDAASAALFQDADQALDGVMQKYVSLQQSSLRRRTIAFDTEETTDYQLLENGEEEASIPAPRGRMSA